CWYVNYMNYSDMHEISSGKSQKIALIDSGISKFQKVYKNINLTNSNNDYDTNGHGTMMYSIIKGYNKNNQTIEGISPDSRIILIKVMNDDESINPNVIEDAIDYALNEKVDIISLSLGSTKTDINIKQKIDKANLKNITVVSSAGDYKQGFLLFPASLNNVISVGSIDDRRDISTLTNAPQKTLINAPGEKIKVIDNNNNVFYGKGTSEATAIITGYIALMRDTNISSTQILTNEKIMNLLSQINKNEKTYLGALKEIRKKVSVSTGAFFSFDLSY
ncbi:S8/S53 family peptidase, partial [Clostridioides difficile]